MGGRDVVIGTGLAAAAMLGCATGGMAWVVGAVAGGIVGNVSDRVVARLLHEARTRTAGLEELPENHDLARAVRLAQIQALQRSLNDQAALHAGADAAFVPRALQFCNDTIGMCRSVKLNIAVTETLGAAIDGLLADAPAGTPAGQRNEAIAGWAEGVVLAELAFHCFGEDADPETAFPASYLSHFRQGQDAARPRYLALYGAFIAEQIRENPPFRAILNAWQLARIEGLGFDTAEMLHRLERHFGAALTRIETKVDALSADMAQLMAALRQSGVIPRAEAEGLAERTILAFAQRLRPEEAHDLDSAVRAVENAVEIALDLIRRGERLTSNEDAFVGTVLAEVARRTRAGDLEGGARAVDDGLAELDAREAEQRDALRRARTTLLETGIGQEILRRDAAAAARRVEALVALDAPDRPAWAPAFRARWDAFHEEGRDKGLNLSLEIAIALARRMLATAATPDERGTAGNLLGLALQTLGARESGTARLEEAVAAYRAALEEWTRDRVPLDWARTQNNLGTALATLGARESGTARLEAAVAAYRAALEERTRERVPLDWAMTQNNLGNALQTLGARESGTARLEAAVAAYRAALEGMTRDRVPLDWAGTQNNLGNALQTLGERESGTERLEAAVAAYRAALEEWTRDRVPLDWAGTQNNLGNALATLGARESGTARLEEAVAAYRAALEERTRERVPLDWAGTQNNLGEAEEAWGDKTGDATRWRAALVHAELALAVFREANATFYVAEVVKLRDRVAAKLGAETPPGP